MRGNRLRGGEEQHRAEALAASLDEVAGRVRDERIIARNGLPKAGLNPRQPRRQTGFQRTVRKGEAQQGVSHQANYRMKTSALLTRSSTGCGTMPRTIVTVAPAASAIVVKVDGTTTEAVSGPGSEKNISTITRA